MMATFLLIMSCQTFYKSRYFHVLTRLDISSSNVFFYPPSVSKGTLCILTRFESEKSLCNSFLSALSVPRIYDQHSLSLAKPNSL